MEALERAAAALQAQNEHMKVVLAQAELTGPNTPVMKIPLVGVTKAELTINNTEEDLTFRIMRYRRDKDKKKPPEWFWLDVRDLGAHTRHSTIRSYTKVAIIRCLYENPEDADRVDDDQGSDEDDSSAGPEVVVPFAIPKYQFELRTAKDASKEPVILYAAHLIFLQLTGVDYRTERWTDCLQIEREPTDRYEIQPVTSCMRCGRKLVKPSSIDDGFGPICLGKLAKKYDTRAVQWRRPSE